MAPKADAQILLPYAPKAFVGGGGNSIGEVRKKGRAETRTGVVSMDHRYSGFPTSM